MRMTTHPGSFSGGFTGRPGYFNPTPATLVAARHRRAESVALRDVVRAEGYDELRWQAQARLARQVQEREDRWSRATGESRN
jgi:hypothetical protein